MISKDRERYLSHIRDEDERKTISKLLDKIDNVRDRYVTEITDFLNPSEVKLSKAVLNSFDDINYFIFEDDNDEVERKIIAITPEFIGEINFDEHIKLIRCKGQFSELEHRDFLGTIMSHGLVREKIGDIYIGETNCDIAVLKPVANYLISNLEKVRNVKMTCEYIDIDEMIIPTRADIEKVVVVSSMRVDLIVAACYGISRQKVIELIRRDLIKLNWQVVDKSSRVTEIGDKISVRKYGRFKIESMDGLSAKGKFRLKLRISD